MLAFIRRALSSWIVLAFLGLLLVAFVITGIGDPFGGGGAPRAGSVARVGDSEVTEPQLAQAFDRFVTRAREENPQITNAQAVREGALDGIFGQLVDARALEVFGAENGIVVSERMIDGEIASIPAFQVGGRFDQNAFRSALAAQRIPERELRESIRGDLMRRLMLAPVAAGSPTPRLLSEPYASLLLEQRRGQVATIPVASVGEVGAPTDAQLNAFYRQNVATYTIPERRPFRYALLSRDALAAGVAVSDADVKKYYDDNRETYGGVERRTLSQVVVPDQAAATALVSQVSGGTAFAAAAQAAGFSPEDTALGEQTEPRLAEATSAAVARAAFTAPSGGLAGPVQSEFGWHVIRVDSIAAANPRPIADVRPEIVTTLRNERADDLLADAVAKIEDALGAGESLADVAQANSLTIVDVPPVTRDGRVVDAPGPLDQRAGALLDSVFDAEAGAEPVVEEIDETNFAVLDVGDVVAPRPVPLAQIRAAVAADWQRVERMRRAKSIADAVVAEVRKGTALSAALAARKLPAATPFAGRRIDLARSGQQVPPPIALLFSLPANEVRALAGPRGAGFYVVKVDAVIPGDAAGQPAIAEQLGRQIAQGYQAELVSGFARAVAAEVGVSRDAAAVERIRNTYLGQGDVSE